MFIAFSIISIFVSNSQAYAVEGIWRDYESMKELVKDIRNGDKDDDKMNYDKFKDSSVYKNAKEDLRRCIDLADKVGEKLGDYEIVRCFENTNYFKEKYVDGNNENVSQQEQQNETNQNQSSTEEAVQQKELQLTENNSEQQGQQNVTNQNQNQNQTKDERKTRTSDSNVGSNDGCDPSYPDICITTYSEKLSCADIPFRNFKVLPPDTHGFDTDRDGVGCEG
ncbi:MAG: hypothetical protein QOK79_06865 [Nitrososphaeraceae archaeon]|nr:hypothetical protein [Nitrososphaeraceae archaeon]MDW0225592.1 hypothetical protein [Nitrososphaeraceae archaeon]